MFGIVRLQRKRSQYSGSVAAVLGEEVAVNVVERIAGAVFKRPR